MNLKGKNREVKIAEKHLAHCEMEAKRDPKNKYWKNQIEKTRKLLENAR
jgi:hypothetical protein